MRRAIALLVIAGLGLVGTSLWWQQQTIADYWPDRVALLDPSEFAHESGLAHWAFTPLELADVATDAPTDPPQAAGPGPSSPLLLFENGKPLAGHALHEDIRKRGGFYSHWRDRILFSSRDGSDPRENGARYEVRVPSAPPVWAPLILPVLHGASATLLALAVALMGVSLWRGPLRTRISTQGAAWALLAFAMVFASASEWMWRQPAERFLSHQQIKLDPSGFRPERGIAFVVALPPAALAIVSDSDGVSRLELRENGRRLSPHQAHSNIRTKPGLYSHWGDSLYLSTSDGSDPRVGAPRYEIQFPGEWPGVIKQARVAVLALCAGLTLFWAGVVGRRVFGRPSSLIGRPAWACLAGAFGVAAGALLAASVPLDWRGFQTLELSGTSFRPYASYGYTDAYIRALPPATRDLPSGRFGQSSLELLHEGRLLTSHGLLDAAMAPGSFVHWPNALVIRLHEGRDPRKGPDRLTLRQPADVSPLERSLQLAGSLLAAVLFLASLHALLGSVPRRTLLAVPAAVTFGALVALGVVGPRVPLELSGLDAVTRSLADRSRGGDPATDANKANRATQATGSFRRRTLRLMDSPAFEFYPAQGASAPKPPSEIRLALQPVDGSSTPGAVDLARVELRSATPLGLDPAELASLEMRVRVEREGSLTVRFSEAPTATGEGPYTDLLVPLEASDDVQTIRLVEPALGGPARVVDFVSFVSPRQPLKAPALEVLELTLRDRLAVYLAAPHGQGGVALAGNLRPALWQSAPGRFAMKIPPGAGDRLALAVGALGGKADRVGFRVVLQDDRGSRTTLAAGDVSPAAPWTEVAVELPASRAGTLWLEGDALPTGDVLIWSGVRVIDTSRPPRRVMVLLVDTLRFDALGSSLQGEAQTENLDAVAAEGARFTRAYSQSFWTRPSMPSIMTGRYVGATGVQALDQRLPERFQTLAESFTEGGFTTVSIVTNPNAGPGAGLHQGFDRLRLPASLSSNVRGETASLIDQVVFPAVAPVAHDDLLLYVHLMEAHGPYGSVAAPKDLELPTGGTPVVRNPAYDRPWAEATVEMRRALYRYDVRSLDRALGRLFDFVRTEWDPTGSQATVIAVVSDHGEFLGEYDQWGHNFAQLFPEVVQVPLLLRAPGQIPAGVVWESPVENRHVGATLLDLAGIRPATPESELPLESVRGESLLPRLQGAGASSRSRDYAISTGALVADTDVFSLYGNGYSYVGREEAGRVLVETFSDAAARKPTSRVWPYEALEEGFRQLVGSYRETQGKQRDAMWAGHTQEPRTIDPKQQEMLRALGYLE